MAKKLYSGRSGASARAGNKYSFGPNQGRFTETTAVRSGKTETKKFITGRSFGNPSYKPGKAESYVVPNKPKKRK
jgi:hypothetical protein